MPHKNLILKLKNKQKDQAVCQLKTKKEALLKNIGIIKISHKMSYFKSVLLCLPFSI